MKLNRTALIAAVVTVAASLAVGAVAASQTQTAPKAKGGHGGCMHMRKMFAEKLNLTDGQKEKLKAIRTDMKAKAKAIKQNDSLDRDAKRSQFKALKEAAKLQIDQVLTPDQKDQIKSMKEEAKQRRAERRAKKPQNKLTTA